MKKNVEMISLNSTKSDFKEDMDLDERLQKLESNELKSIKAGENCPRMGCPSDCADRCDSDDCYTDCWDDFCPRMDPT